MLCGGKRVKVVSNTASQLTLESAVTVADNDVIYPGEGGKEGLAVYGCLFIGKGAYGVVDLSEGTEVIVKPRGSSGTADPLDQRSSVGWKGIHAAAILYDEYIVRVECGSSYSAEDKANQAGEKSGDFIAGKLSGLALRIKEEPTMARKQETAQRMVSVTIPRGRKQEENFVIVSVNGRSWKIMKGVQVQVPDYVAEVLENARMMADEARRYVDRMAD